MILPASINKRSLYDEPLFQILSNNVLFLILLGNDVNIMADADLFWAV
jgi:hypothetical protein